MNVEHWIFDKQSSVPLYLQLYHHLREEILQGTFVAHRRLPASRQLAADLGVARVTVSQAYDQLAAEGFVARRQGAGTFIAAHLPLAKAMPETRPFQPRFSSWGRQVLDTAVTPSTQSTRPEIDFGFGRSFPHIFLYDIWRKLLARYLSTDDVMLSRFGSVAGYMPLREALADHLTHWRGVAVPARTNSDCEWGAASPGYFGAAAAGARR